MSQPWLAFFRHITEVVRNPVLNLLITIYTNIYIFIVYVDKSLIEICKTKPTIINQDLVPGVIMEKVSVVICTHSNNRYQDAIDSINSVLNQTYKETEIIVVVDRNTPLFERIESEFRGHKVIKTFHNLLDSGLSAARNKAIIHSTGDILAFLDDDAIADEKWLEHLLLAYRKKDVIGCGGPIRPLWISGMADWIPEELYWTMGCTYKGFDNRLRPVRSNFGSNMSFRRKAFDIHNFNINYGINNNRGVGEEIEFSLRILRENPDSKIMHIPGALVYHKIFDFRKSVSHLFDRCFQYGENFGQFSKELKNLPEWVNRDDNEMKKYLIFKAIPSRIMGLFNFKDANHHVVKDLSRLTILLLSSYVIILGIFSSLFIVGKARR
jgi:glycosyltransferase involved in cell wall biosynthesis